MKICRHNGFSSLHSAAGAFVLAILFSLKSCVALAGEETIVHAGLTLNADLVLAGSGLADGVILMLHGTLGHKDMEIITAMQSVFAENGRSSLAINLSLDIDDRHGFYPCDRPHTHKLDDADAELTAWVHWLEANGAGEIVLFGHSRGANQVARFVIENRPVVRGAILLAPSAAEVVTPGDRRSLVTLAGGSEWLNDVNFLYCDRASVTGESYLSYYGSADLLDTPALLAKFTIPAVVFSGSDDDVVVNLGEQMLVVQNELVTHVEIDGADHFFRDLYAYDVVERALEFMDAL